MFRKIGDCDNSSHGHVVVTFFTEEFELHAGNSQKCSLASLNRQWSGGGSHDLNQKGQTRIKVEHARSGRRREKSLGQLNALPLF